MNKSNWRIKATALALGTTLLFSSLGQAQAASTYTVKSGDSLHTIGLKYGVSYQKLIAWNKLSSPVIYPGQTLTINTEKEPSTTNKTNTSSNKTTYTVKSVDSLSKIASKYGVTIKNLMSWNKLSSSNIYVGQKLTVGSSSVQGVTANTSVALSTKVVSAAKEYLGVKYTFGGSKPSTGFDCSGFITYVFNKAGISTSRKTAAGFYSASNKISSPRVGDLVFFRDTYKSGISHVGIYIGNNRMISASGSKVQIENVYNTYWKKRLVGYGNFS